jgi:hypothetical protein
MLKEFYEVDDRNVRYYVVPNEITLPKNIGEVIPAWDVRTGQRTDWDGEEIKTFNDWAVLKVDPPGDNRKSRAVGMEPRWPV